MIYLAPPFDFKSKYEIVSCFCIWKDKILLLHRQDHKPQGNQWGIPAGKVDTEEDRTSALQRELQEETGLMVDKENLGYIDKKYIRYPKFDFTFYTYRTTVTNDIKVAINPKEHKAFLWIKPKESSTLPLMEDIGECIKEYLLNSPNPLSQGG